MVRYSQETYYHIVFLHAYTVLELGRGFFKECVNGFDFNRPRVLLV